MNLSGPRTSNPAVNQAIFWTLLVAVGVGVLAWANLAIQLSTSRHLGPVMRVACIAQAWVLGTLWAFFAALAFWNS